MMSSASRRRNQNFQHLTRTEFDVINAVGANRHANVDSFAKFCQPIRIIELCSFELQLIVSEKEVVEVVSFRFYDRLQF